MPIDTRYWIIALASIILAFAAYAYLIGLVGVDALGSGMESVERTRLRVYSVGLELSGGYISAVSISLESTLQPSREYLVEVSVSTSSGCSASGSALATLGSANLLIQVSPQCLHDGSEVRISIEEA